MPNPSLTKGERGESLNVYLGRELRVSQGSLQKRKGRGDISNSPSFTSFLLRFSSLEKLLDLKKKNKKKLSSCLSYVHTPEVTSTSKLLVEMPSVVPSVIFGLKWPKCN